MGFTKWFGKVICFVIMGGMVLGIPFQALAVEETEDYILEDTVVTATKTGETRLQETPMTITAFSGDILNFTILALGSISFNSYFILRKRKILSTILPKKAILNSFPETPNFFATSEI